MDQGGQLVIQRRILLPEHRCNKFDVFYRACVKGRLRIAQWLHKKYKFTRTELRGMDNMIFSDVCVRGHLEVAQWLLDEFAFELEDVESESTHAFSGALENGYMDVARLLSKNFDLTNSLSDDQFIRMCRFGKLKNIKWYYKTLRPHHKVHLGEYNVLKMAQEGDLQKLQWLHKTFGIADPEGEAWDSRYLAHRKGNYRLVKWITETFDIPPMAKKERALGLGAFILDS